MKIKLLLMAVLLLHMELVLADCAEKFIDKWFKILKFLLEISESFFLDVKVFD